VLRPGIAIIAIGAAWGLVATGAHLAIFSGLLPPPGDLPLPLAITVVLTDLPLLGALFLETAAGRGSPTLNEVTAVSIVSGALIAIALAAVVFGVRRVVT
jgi:hypothetical protein